MEFYVTNREDRIRHEYYKTIALRRRAFAPKTRQVICYVNIIDAVLHFKIETICELFR